MGKILFYFISLLLLSVMNLSFISPPDVFMTKAGKVKFTSSAPLETIEAQSIKGSVALNTAMRSLAFKLPVASFEGFNSALQQEHFNENYMETSKHVYATFTGKIIEEVDLTKAGTYKVRAKGMLDIHGVQKERIITGTIVVGATSVKLSSNFDVPLSDHNISIPKIVLQKIAEIIKVEVNAELKPQ